jgi:glutathione S-transferase
LAPCKIREPLTSTALPLLFSFRRCPYAIRARLALAVSGVAHTVQEVALANKPAALFAASAKGTVPVLVLPSGQVIDESLNIMVWALGQNDPEHWLVAQGGKALIAHNDGPFKHSLDRYKYPHRFATEFTDSAAFSSAHRALAANWLAGLEAQLGQGWLLVAQPSLADMAILPFVRQFARTDAAWFAQHPWPNLQTWLARFEASERFVAVMEKTTLPPTAMVKEFRTGHKIDVNLQ